MEYSAGPNPTHYGLKSRERLETCHQDHQRILNALALDGWDISVVCGHRDEIEQNKAYFSHKSNAKWPDSDHNISPSNAVDVAPYIPGVGIPWENHDNLWVILAGAFLAKAQELGIDVEWGGLYKNLKDLGHFSLIT